MSGDALGAAMRVAALGLDNEALRMRVVSENIANARSTGDAPGEAAYRRKTVSFAEVTGTPRDGPRVRVATDRSALPLAYQPGHPAADARGMVAMPNVSMLTEIADMREATRAYEANVQVLRQTRDLVNTTIDLLRTR